MLRGTKKGTLYVKETCLWRIASYSKLKKRTGVRTKAVFTVNKFLTSAINRHRSKVKSLCTYPCIFPSIAKLEDDIRLEYLSN